MTRASGADALADRFAQEIAAMRSLIEEQLAQLAWSDTLRRSPLRGRLTRVLLEAGFSNALAREIMQRLPDDFSAQQAQEWLVGVLARNVRCAASEYDIVTRGGVYALVGPTGVGKTTTTAKLAARCAVRYGAGKLALLTTDSYRVGAHDQLRIYAKILGVPVHTVSDHQDLRQALDSMRGKHLVLIDTVGMSQRDERVREQSMLLAQPEVQRMLLLNAAAQSETLEEVVAAYTRAPELGNATDIAGCVLTKVDEAGQLGQALDVLIRHRLPLNYTSSGQRVPEDLHEPSATYLVHRSLRRGAKPTAFTLDDEAFSLIGGGAGVAHA
jgi:flagellar biosynthesis protein FlhF